MMRLDPVQLDKKMDYIHNYIRSRNAADGSVFDANANVSTKNIATLAAELNKDINIQINRSMVHQKITEMFGADLAQEYLRQIEEHEIYVHDESSLNPYCVSISMYPFLLDGLTKMGGESKAPKHLNSFCGSFVNLVFAVSSQFAGAVATVEFLTYFDYFARKDYGDDYLNTHTHEIENHFQHVVYALNQPAAARGYQSVFWNISIYDESYFNGMFGNFMFPDLSPPSWQSVKRLQEFFMDWFNDERSKAVLTFPIVTAAFISKAGHHEDSEFVDMMAKQLSKGNAFFIYLSDTPDSLSSCCRLKNKIDDSINDFSYSLGAGGVSTGSTNVITINFNRLIQNNDDLPTLVNKIHKYQVAHRKLLEEFLQHGLLSVYDAGFIQMDKQYLTIGINGLVEGLEYLGFEISNNDAYLSKLEEILGTISSLNKMASKDYGYKFNTELVPAENLGAKNAKWDKEDGYEVPRDCYNSYFYVVEDDDVSILDKFEMHGNRVVGVLDGGSAYHCNLENYPTAEGFKKLIDVASVAGCDYFCFNVKVTICEECGHIDKRTKYDCSKCGSKNISHATRVIGYLKKIKDFSSVRQNEELMRHYSKS